MTTRYLIPDGSRHRFTGRLQYIPGIGALSGNETPAELQSLGLTPAPPEPPPKVQPPPPTPPAILALADEILAVWAPTGLPLPASPQAARQALRPARKGNAAARLAAIETALDLRDLADSLAQAGGTWQNVLDRAKTSPQLTTDH